MRHKRVVVAHYGGPEVITAIEEELPTPKAGEVRVKVLAAGVSLPDVLARQGVHPETPRVPYTPGWGSRRNRRSTRRGHDWPRTAPDSRRYAHPRVLRAVPVRAPTQACPRVGERGDVSIHAPARGATSARLSVVLVNSVTGMGIGPKCDGKQISGAEWALIFRPGSTWPAGGDATGLGSNTEPATDSGMYNGR
jgi:hypothetical protein